MVHHANTFVQELFLQWLPANVRMVLASANLSIVTAEKFSNMADEVMEVAATAPSISAVDNTHTRCMDNMQSDIKQLRQEVSHLTELVSTLSRSRTHQRSLSCPRRPSTPRCDSTSTQESLYWYHQKFGEAAQKCQEPCNWGSQAAREWRQAMSAPAPVVSYSMIQMHILIHAFLLTLVLK